MFNTTLFPAMPNQPFNFTPLEQYRFLIQQAEAKIQRGVQTVYASTGYPINWLNGGAHTNAVLAAIGGGTTRAGGYGVCGGIQVLMQYAAVCGAYYGYQQGRKDSQYWL